MVDADTHPIPRDELRGLIDTTKVDDHERRTVQMEPLQLEKLLLPERTTADLVVKLEKRKQQSLNLVRLMAISVLAGVWLGLAALAVG